MNCKLEMWNKRRWAHFTVHLCLCVCIWVFLVNVCMLYYCNMVRWTWWYWSIIHASHAPPPRSTARSTPMPRSRDCGQGSEYRAEPGWQRCLVHSKLKSHAHCIVVCIGPSHNYWYCVSQKRCGNMAYPYHIVPLLALILKHKWIY